MLLLQPFTALLLFELFELVRLFVPCKRVFILLVPCKQILYNVNILLDGIFLVHVDIWFLSDLVLITFR